MKTKLILIGFLVLVLLAIPLTIFILQQQTQTAQHAAPSTNISLSTTQQQLTVGQNFQVNVNIDPGSNQISFVKLNISYDKTKIATAGAGITPNQSLNLQTLEGPTYTNCSGNTCYISVAYGIAANKANAISSADTLATINFTAVASTTDTGSTTVGFGNGNQAYSLAPTDQPTQNAIVNTQSLQLTINDVASPTPAEATDTPTPATVTDTPTPEQTSGGGTNGGGENTTPTTVASNSSLLCNSLTADNTSSPSAPFTVNFTVIGSDTTSNVNQVTLNFGDGSTQDLTSGGGIGTGSINAQISHTYPNTGIFTSSAILTDDTGATSDSSSCTQVITIGTNQPTNSPTPTLSGTPLTAMNTGPGSTFLILGGIGSIITIIGAAILFGL